MNLGFTGTRKGMTAMQIEAVTGIFRKLKPTEFHHGDCVGADHNAHAIMRHLQDDGLDCKIYLHPPIKSKTRAFCEGAFYSFPEREYIERDKDIVDYTDILLACPNTKEEQQRSGTWTTVRYARKSNKRVIIVFPDGTMNQTVY